MEKFLFFVTISVTALVLGATTVQAAIPTSERGVLLNLYTSTNGASWTAKTGWNGAAGTECNWYGITCDTGKNNVISIDLATNNLTGSIPASLNTLKNLQYFNVSNNQLSGSIPALSGLTNLMYLYVSNNQLSGSIPTLTGLTNLIYFYVSTNQLSGTIPALNGLTNLQYFDVDTNQLSGTIPSLTGQTSLVYFAAFTNQLSGTIPALTGLTNLVNFDVNTNQLSGTIPALTGLTNLVNFNVNANQLSGSIPTLAGLTNLQYFDVNTNQLSGPIPAFTGLTNLQYFDVDTNQLSGPIPALTGLANLQYFDVDTNQLSGSIPALTGLTNLETFDVDTNQLSGPIPALTGLTELFYFAAFTNQLTGSIPALTGLTNLQNFDVSNNQLTGSIPSLAGLTNLLDLYVQNNQLTGTVPPVPSPDALVASGSTLCPNYLSKIADPAWDAATGQIPWYTNCSDVIATYSVTYNGNGNTGGSVPTDGNAYIPGATVTVLSNSGNLVMNINSLLMNFAGWNTVATGTGKSYVGGDTFVISSNVNLYAQWAVASSASLFLAFDPSGTGVGTLSAPMLGLSCGSGCSSNQMQTGIQYTVTATPNQYSLLTSLTGLNCSAATGICTFTPAGDVTVTARFDYDSAHQAFVVDGNDPGIYYSSLQAAYNGADSGATIMAWTQNYSENLSCTINKAVILRGGYNQAYTSVNGWITLNGILTTSLGSVTIDGLIIQ